MVKLDFSKTRLFKYLSPDGAKKSLSTRTIKFSKPSEFNDPFDMRIDELIGLDFRKFAEELGHEMFEFLSGELGSLRNSKIGNMAAIINNALRSASPEVKKAIHDEVIATNIDELYDFDDINKSHKNTLEKIQGSLNCHGVFCTTLNHDSLLMWAHYAQSHQGAVFEFAPDFERDSVLCASKPVRYNKERPLVFRHPSDMLRHGITMSPDESTRQIIDDLIFTKSPEWSYEREFRLAIPKFIDIGATCNTLNFAPSELSAVYLGCRINQNDRDELISMTRSINEEAQIYQARISAREYALEFAQI
jgi:hypothetical protein